MNNLSYMGFEDKDSQKLQAVIDHLNMNWDETQNIPTKSLNVNGTVIQDKMETYLSNGDKFRSSSDVKEMIKSPFHYRYYREDGFKNAVDAYKKKSEAFQLGTFLHSAILEPSIFNKMLPAPNFPMNTHKGLDGLLEWWPKTILNLNGKEALEEVEDHINKAVEQAKVDTEKVDGKKFVISLYESNSELPVIPEDQFAICNVVKTWYFNYGDGLLPRILKHSKREVSIYDDKNFELPLKIRPDAMVFEENAGKNIIVSIKSTNSPYPRKFFSDYASYEYPVSDAMYNEVASKVTGRNFDTTLCIMVQNTAPYGVGVFMLKEEDLQISKHKFYTALSTMKECEETGLYPGFESLAERGHMGISFVHLPGWYNHDLLPVDIES